MSLRSQINLIIATLMVLFIGALAYQQIEGTRASVREEVEGSNIVATQLLTRMSWVYEQAGTQAMVGFLNSVGHVRANDVSLYDPEDRPIYRSPPPSYKQGRDAPAWFTHVVTPAIVPQVVRFAGGRLVIQADPSRAILDGWDDLERVLAIGGALCAGLFAAAVWLTRRALAPLGEVVRGLQSLQQGHYATRLPPLPGAEARLMSRAFNDMAQAVEDTAPARNAATAAQLDLARNRELTLAIQSNVEAQRRAIAHELHDELGQSITAIKSMGLSILQRTPKTDAATTGAAQLIVDTAARMYDATHELVGRLRPFAIDDFGLADALRDLVTGLRQQHPQVEFALQVDALPAQLGDSISTCAYRIVQESLTNALRHAQARHVAVELACDESTLRIAVRHDGTGLPADWQRPGHFGVRGMRERAKALGGNLDVATAPGGGVAVQASLPLY